MCNIVSEFTRSQSPQYLVGIPCPHEKMDDTKKIRKYKMRILFYSNHPIARTWEILIRLHSFLVFRKISNIRFYLLMIEIQIVAGRPFNFKYPSINI